MKKVTMYFAALACSLAAMILTACGGENVTYQTVYMYEISFDLGGSYYQLREKIEIEDAFNSALGTDGYSYKTYESMQDSKMKSACDAVKRRYADIQSIYLKFDLLRVTMSAEPGSQRKNDTIASYIMGRALNYDYVTYSLSYNEDEAYDAMEAKKDVVDEKVYKAGYKTLRTLIGRHVKSGGSSYTASSAFDMCFQGLTNKPYMDSETFDRAVCSVCDSIVSAHSCDTLLVPAVISFAKTGLLDKQVTEIWRDTVPANVQ